MAAETQNSVLQIERVHCLSDNFAWLLHEPQHGVTAVVDPSEAAPVLSALQAKGWKLTHIINSEWPAAVVCLLANHGSPATGWPGCYLPDQAHQVGGHALPTLTRVLSRHTRSM
jgi:hypothetical protein